MSRPKTKSRSSQVVGGRHVTLFDAIEGRVIKKKATGFQHTNGHSRRLLSSTNTNTARSAATPEDSLAVRLGCQASRLPVVEQSVQTMLPSSTLLNALHTFTACFYEKHQLLTPGFDESALIALGLFAEESVDIMVCSRVEGLLEACQGSSAKVS